MSSPLHLSKADLRRLSELTLPQLFAEIYRKQLWGSGHTGQYFSGSGSHEPSIVDPYLEMFKKFILRLDNRPVIVDLGCGDFQVGSQLSGLAEHYHGCDIVPDLIEFLRNNNRQDNVQFHCLDATEEDLPDGDVLIVRQVFQHLSNNDIVKILQQFQSSRYILVTEHLPKTAFTANKNKPNGPDTRLRWQSGVDLLQPPFNLQVNNALTLCQSNDPLYSSTVIKTVLYEI